MLWHIRDHLWGCPELLPEVAETHPPAKYDLLETDGKRNACLQWYQCGHWWMEEDRNPWLQLRLPAVVTPQGISGDRLVGPG